jgi:hypothetical protein
VRCLGHDAAASKPELVPQGSKQAINPTPATPALTNPFIPPPLTVRACYGIEP